MLRAMLPLLSVGTYWMNGLPTPLLSFTLYVASHHRISRCYKLNFAGGSGRRDGTKADPVIGSVILHDKLSAWTEKATKTHYHQGAVLL